jgi:conjugative relaxase-like TrwC/TraI family protein
VSTSLLVMLSIHVHANAKDVVRYHDDHLRGATANDYYSQGDPALGRFFGQGIEHLGVKQLPYSKDAFQRLCSNLHPVTGKQLTVRKKEGARAAYDCTLSAPKSVSVMALVMDDRRVLEAHRAAVSETLALLESRALTRIRKNGEYADRPTGNLVGVGFEHLTSRAGDPNCHEHCVVFNATFDTEEQRWKALQSSGIYQASGLATEVYRSTLVAKLREVGYEARRTDHGFEIAGVPQEVIDCFSKRRKQIESIAAELGQSNNPEALAAIARTSRKPKDETVSVESMRKAWFAELTDEQKQALQKLKDSARKPVKHRKVSAKEALAWAKDHCFERKSVIKADELAKEAMRYARGDNSLAELQQAISSRIKSHDLIAKDGKLTTAQSLRDEKELIDIATNGVGKCVEFSTSFVPDPKLSDEQRAVVLQTLKSTSFITAVIGPAGAGKSTLLKSVVRGLRSEGINPTLLAPSGSATGVLRGDGFTGAQTLQRFLLDKDMQERSANRVVILDESSMVSLSQMLTLTRICKKNNTRLVLVGDTKQLHSVEAGDAFRIILSEDKIPCARLDTVIRQKHARYREAVTLIKDGEEVRGFDALDLIGWVHEMTGTTGDQRAQPLAEEFAEALARGKSALAVTHTWREAEVVTEAIRNNLRNLGVIGQKEQTMRVLVPRHATQAERKDPTSLGIGAVLVFRDKTTHFERGDEAKVIEVRENTVTVVGKGGKTVILNPKKLAKHYGVYDQQDIGVSRGDKLLLRAKHSPKKGKQLTNGEIVTVREVRGENIVLADGREIPSSYRHFRHGYCTSIESSQGKTVDHVFLSVDAQAAHSAGSLEGFYVAVSRGRHTCAIYTDAKEELREAIQNTRARDAATELLNGKTHEKRKQQRSRLPDSRQVAHPPGRHPLHRHAPGRTGTRPVLRDSDDHQHKAGHENPLPAPATRAIDRGRGGLAHD